MASRGLEEFGRRMRSIARDFDGNVSRVVRRAALAADQVVVLATPVDTGRARANWITTIGAPSNEADRAEDPSGASALANGQEVIASWRSGKGSIFITNNVPYIVFLDQGSSAQAPRGMTRQALQAARNELRKGGVLPRTGVGSRGLFR